MPKNTLQNEKTGTKRNITKNIESVDRFNWLKKDTHEDPRINSLMRIVRWQGRVIVFLIVALIVAIALNFIDLNIKLPNQEALQTTPPYTLQDLDYQSLAYAGNTRLSHNSVTNQKEITLIGRIMDADKIQKKWPDFQFIINNAVVPLTDNNSQYKIFFNLKPGHNIVETAIRIHGQLYLRKQMVLTYEPESKDVNMATSTNE
ncbi:MAG: hypothetical protein ACOYUZ_01885 [Patescibacteria group bacterium]